MSPRKRTARSNVSQLLRKTIVSAFVGGTFVAYAIHDRLTNSDTIPAPINPNDVAFVTTPTDVPATDVSATTTQIPASVIPSALPSATSTTQPTQTQLPSQTSIPSTPTQLPTATSTNVPSATSTHIPTDTPIPQPTATVTKSGLYKNGQYTGISANAFYGNVQVKVVISGGKITDVQFLDYPHDRRTSQYINAQAMPYLKNETIKAQSAQVDVISGATLTSEAFIQSLQSALSKAT